MRLSEFSKQINENVISDIIGRATGALASATGFDEFQSNRILKQEIRRVVDEWNKYYRGLPTSLRQNLTLDDIVDFFSGVGYGKSGPDIIRQRISSTQQQPTQQQPPLDSGDTVSYTTPSGVEKEATVVDVSDDEIRFQSDDGSRFRVRIEDMSDYNIVKTATSVSEAKTSPKDSDTANVVKDMKNIISLAVSKAVNDDPRLWANVVRYHRGAGKSDDTGREKSTTQRSLSNQQISALRPISRKLDQADDRKFSDLGLSDEEVTTLRNFLKDQAR